MAVQEITRDEIDAALQIFLAKGGVIEKIDQDNSFRFLFHNFLAMENEEFKTLMNDKLQFPLSFKGPEAITEEISNSVEGLKKVAGSL